ncbi:MAG: chloride channel protein [Acidimicrobiia bacterium]|nr:chloride channel protein [Acidimicrobiia bacterium]
MRRLFESLRTPFARRGAAAFMALALVTGVVVGVAAAVLIWAIEGVAELVHWLQEETGTDLVLLVTVPLGLVAAWFVAHRFAPEVAGDGVPEASAALAIRSGDMPARTAPLKILATALTVGPGGSAGREGPIVQVGSAIGSFVARTTGLGEDRVRSLVAAGAGAAIGASFNAPIAGMLFALEVILGNFAIRHLNAVVVSSVAAAVTTRSIVGQDLILRAIPHRLNDWRELVLYAGIGLAAAVVGWLFLRALSVVESARPNLPGWVRPVALGLGVAGIGLWESDVLGTGESVVGGLLDLLTTSQEVWWVLLALGGAKLVATVLTLGSHGSGGAFMPSLFIGAALGAGAADLVGPFWSISALQPGAFAVVGMAATFAAVARAPLTSILIVFEITGDYGLVLPLMLAASLATFLADLLHPESVYTMALRRRGIHLTRRSEVDVLDTVAVGSVAGPIAAVVDPAMSTADVQGLLDRHRHHGLPVVANGRLVGVITVTDIVRTGGPSDAVSAADAMTPRPVTATLETPVSVALERMASIGVGRVPIVAEDDPTRLVGLFRREDAVTAYHLALGQEVDHEVDTERLRTRIDPGARFFEVIVGTDSLADGRLLKELPVPGAGTIVSVRRGLNVIVPDGSTRLAAGDVLTFFGSTVAADQFERRLGGAEHVTGEIRLGAEGATYFEVEIPVGSSTDGRRVAEVAIPSGCTVVAVRRGDDTLVPDGATVLRAGDVLTIFALPGSRDQFVERLRGAG